MTIYFLYNTLVEYYRYEYTTNFMEKRSAPPFPDITICKINPILFRGKDADDYSNYKTILQSHNDMNKRNNSDDNETTRDRVQAFLLDLTGRVGYFQYTNASHILDAFNKSFVIHCEIGLWTGQNKDCYLHVEQHPLFLQPDTPLCVKISPLEEDRTSIRSIETIIYLDDNRCDEDTDLSVQNLLSVGANGIFVLPHGTAVEPAKYDGIRVPPGVEMDLLVNAHKFERLGNPFSNCSDIIQVSEEVCVLSCVQEMVIKKCKCLDPYLPTSSTQRSKYSFCGNVSADHETFSKNTRCYINRNWTTEEAYCTDKCYPPCSETKYEFQQAASKWPHELFRTVLYSYVKDHPAISDMVQRELSCSIKHDKDIKLFGEGFDDSDKQSTDNETFDCNNGLKNFCTKSSLADPIERNFLKVNIILTKRVLEVSIDTPKVSLYQVRTLSFASFSSFLCANTLSLQVVQPL